MRLPVGGCPDRAPGHAALSGRSSPPALPRHLGAPKQLTQKVQDMKQPHVKLSTDVVIAPAAVRCNGCYGLSPLCRSAKAATHLDFRMVSRKKRLGRDQRILLRLCLAQTIGCRLHFPEMVRRAAPWHATTRKSMPASQKEEARVLRCGFEGTLAGGTTACACNRGPMGHHDNAPFSCPFPSRNF